MIDIEIYRSVAGHWPTIPGRVQLKEVAWRLLFEGLQDIHQNSVSLEYGTQIRRIHEVHDKYWTKVLLVAAV